MKNNVDEGECPKTGTGPNGGSVAQEGNRSSSAPNVPFANEDNDPIMRLAMACPLCVDWCSYKGEVYFAGINWERSRKAKRLMFDLSYCATAYLAGGAPIVMKTVAWHPDKFTNIGSSSR